MLKETFSGHVVFTFGLVVESIKELGGASHALKIESICLDKRVESFFSLVQSSIHLEPKKKIIQFTIVFYLSQLHDV
jgi:hypothetical protein